MTSGQETEGLDKLTKEQLTIYAKEVAEQYQTERRLRDELRKSFEGERRLRQEIESRNKQLLQRVAEITALNELFQNHLEQRDAVLGAYKGLLGRLDKLAQQTSDIVDWAKAQQPSEPQDALGTASGESSSD